MTSKVIQGDLKTRIETISRQIFEDHKDAFGESHIAVKEQMWRCGLEVLKDYPGLEEEKERRGRGGALISFQSIGQKIGRDKNTIKRWVDLVKEIGKAEKEWIEWSTREAALVMQRRLNGMIATRQQTIETPEFPELVEKYRVLYADPPWDYNEAGKPLSKKYGEAAKHYPTMNIDEICALPVKDIAADDSVLFLWTTSPKLDKALCQVIPAWGFEYKTSMVWDKGKHNFGYYVSVRHEFLLIATRGSCLPDKKKLYPSVMRYERREHSVKPDEVAEMIDDLYEGKRIELFARKKRKNWEAWGNDV